MGWATGRVGLRNDGPGPGPRPRARLGLGLNDDENIEVVKLKKVCWLDVRGKFKISDLSQGIIYQVVYEVKLTNGARGWELPIMLRLSLPDGKFQERQVSLLEKPKGQWIELNVGKFKAQDTENGEVCFDLYEHGDHWKIGLVIRSAIIRPIT
ncbi:hypothetical protein ACSBR2_017241 [Camellia fascicularis]